MKLLNGILGSLAMAGLALAKTNRTSTIRNVVYLDQYHSTNLPGKNVTAGITHVIMAFANSSLFASGKADAFQAFLPVSNVRALFDEGTKVGLAIGGWGDTAGFRTSVKAKKGRRAFAQSVAKVAGNLGFDFVDVDWEYPGEAGPDYKEMLGTNKTTEVDSFPLLLREIKYAIAPMQLSIAVPALQYDIPAYTASSAQEVFSTVDMVNIMTYDMMGRRGAVSLHHTSVRGSLETVERYLDLGLSPCKINLGLAYYAKYFQTPRNSTCSSPANCPILKATYDNGTDAGTTGAMTFADAAAYTPGPLTNATVSPDGRCGVGTPFVCANSTVGGGACCSSSGFCGATATHCGAGCQGSYGRCAGPDMPREFAKALAHGKLDEDEGGMWYWDAQSRFFWTWDSVELMQRKMREIVEPLHLGGVTAWSLGEDGADWSHIKAVTNAVRGVGRPAAVQQKVERKPYGRGMRPHFHRWVHQG